MQKIMSLLVVRPPFLTSFLNFLDVLEDLRTKPSKSLRTKRKTALPTKPKKALPTKPTKAVPTKPKKALPTKPKKHSKISRRGGEPKGSVSKRKTQNKTRSCAETEHPTEMHPGFSSLSSRSKNDTRLFSGDETEERDLSSKKPGNSDICEDITSYDELFNLPWLVRLESLDNVPDACDISRCFDLTLEGSGVEGIPYFATPSELVSSTNSGFDRDSGSEKSQDMPLFDLDKDGRLIVQSDSGLWSLVH